MLTRTEGEHKSVPPSQLGETPCQMKLLNWSGRQDSNLRSPAPKAGALATTLRPVKPVPLDGEDEGHEPEQLTRS